MLRARVCVVVVMWVGWWVGEVGGMWGLRDGGGGGGRLLCACRSPPPAGSPGGLPQGLLPPLQVSRWPGQAGGCATGSAALRCSPYCRLRELRALAAPFCLQWYKKTHP